MILSVKNIQKQYKDKVILKNVNFNINKEDKIAIVGVNGSGKTTLLKILLEQDYPDNKPNDKYEIKFKSKIRIGYISQNIEYEQTLNALDAIKREIEVEEYEIKAILSKLKMDEFTKPIHLLSGGQKRKIALGMALLKKTDLLILDEPTNHLDEESIMWLEEYLVKYKGAILLVSHDRYFLNKVTHSIFELNQGNLYQYKNTSFDDYLDLKAQRIEEEKAAYRKNKTLYRKEFAWISRGAEARRTKPKDRIERFENLKSKLKQTTHSSLDLTSVASRIGSKTIELKNISKNFENKELFKDFTYNFGRYQRVGIIGPNGSGKTTLLNIIAKKVEATTGIVEYGETIRIGYFSQIFSEVNEELTILDFIRAKAENIETIYGTITAEKLLENFLFPRSITHDKISTLSGGEKKRLFLVELLMDSPNVLILDEPTNDFDIDTLLILEEFIENFQGIVIVVSHDRYFLDKITDSLFYITEDKKVELFNGNYSEYIQSRSKKTKENKEKKNTSQKPKNNVKIKFTFNEQKEFETIDEDIEIIENKLKEIDTKIAENAQDYAVLNDLLKEREQFEQVLEEKQKRWIYLYEKEEAINNSNT